MGEIDEFIDDLSNLRLRNCFNPYLDICGVHDRFNAADIRRSNLKRVLNHLQTVDEIDLWVGRDLGYKGGRRTGIALTDECHLEKYAAHIGLDSLEKATNGSSEKERTAENIFKLIPIISTSVLTWNVFPLHPYSDGAQFSNRSHNKDEAKIGIAYLERICSFFKVRNLIAIGNDAAFATSHIACARVKVRHPSYGGQTQFLLQMRSLYELPVIKGEQIPLL